MNRNYRHDIFEFENDKIKVFISLPEIVYQHDPQRLISFKDNEIKYLTNDCPIYKKITHKKFLLFLDDKPVARAIGFLHPDIKYNDAITLLIGFFDCIDDEECAGHILKLIENYFVTHYQVKTVIAPVNFTTWHSYRFKTFPFSREPYLFEPYNPPYYPQFFKRFGYSILKSYLSRKLDLDAMKGLIQKNTPSYQNVINEGIQLRPIDLKNFDQEIKQLYKFCTSSFKDNFLYTPISFDEFSSMYHEGKDLIVPKYFCIAEKNNEMLGFLFCMPDYINAIRAMNGRHNLFAKIKFLISRRKIKRLLVKTMAVHPDYRKLGLGKALMYWVHNYAIIANYNEAIHVLFIADNPSGNYSSSGENYGVYELLIKELS